MTSQTLTERRYQKRMDRFTKAFGAAATDAGQSILKLYLSETSDNIGIYIDNLSLTKDITTSISTKSIPDTIFRLDRHVLSLAILSACVSQTVSPKNKPSEVSYAMAKAIEDEVYAYLLANHDVEILERVRRATKRKGDIKARRAIMRSESAKLGYEKEAWSGEQRLRVGTWALDLMLGGSLLQLVDRRCTLAPEALENAADVVHGLLRANPSLLPLKAAPEPWTGFTTHIHGYRVQLVKTFQKPVIHALTGAIKSGRMQRVLDAVNHAQSTPWRINERIKDVVEWAYNAQIQVPGLPPLVDLTRERVPDVTWERYDDGQRLAETRACTEMRKRNKSFIGERFGLQQALATADYLKGAPFWCPLTLDYRGRVYNATSFGFQRQDYIRAMFLFERGEILSPNGLFWLKVHVANTGAFDKVDKKPFADRVLWVDDNMDRLLSCADNMKEDLWWTKADSPFMFLAAILELRRGISGQTVRLPVSFDGSCSGLQHLAAMTRDRQTATQVNLCPTMTPGDIYQRVASIAAKVCEEDANSNGERASIARICMNVDGGVSRSLVKRNVMTFSYSSKVYGMRQQHMEDTMDPLGYKVLGKELERHPYAHPDDTFETKAGTTVTRVGRTAASYLARIIHDSIRRVVKRPAEAMDFLIKISHAFSHEAKPVLYHTPLGMPVMLRYPIYDSTQVDLFLHDRGLRLQASTRSETMAIDKKACANAVAPSFVHSMDACHLQMVALAARENGIDDLAFVHDSFGCHPNQATAFRALINGTFAQMYSRDILGDLRAEALTTLNDTSKVPELPEYGDLDITEVTNADYAFA